eukprot:scaffold609_cov234-Pinguiococcus_pyrenoidosus.AAC.5
MARLRSAVPPAAVADFAETGADSILRKTVPTTALTILTRRTRRSSSSLVVGRFRIEGRLGSRSTAGSTSRPNEIGRPEDVTRPTPTRSDSSSSEPLVTWATPVLRRYTALPVTAAARVNACGSSLQPYRDCKKAVSPWAPRALMCAYRACKPRRVVTDFAGCVCSAVTAALASAFASPWT